MKTYLITNIITGEKYVGRTKLKFKKRWGCHKSMARRGLAGKLYNNIRQHGEENFTMEELCEGNREKEFIEKLNPELNMPAPTNYTKAVKVTRRRVRCVETGEEYNSIAEAERLNNISRCGVSNVLNGRAHSAGGFRWEFI